MLKKGPTPKIHACFALSSLFLITLAVILVSGFCLFACFCMQAQNRKHRAASGVSSEWDLNFCTCHISTCVGSNHRLWSPPRGSGGRAGRGEGGEAGRGWVRVRVA